VCRTTVVQDAWRRGQRVTVHGWIYRLQDGLLRNLGFSALSVAEAAASYAAALKRIASSEAD
jgi:carbonic anhydrase